MKKKNNYIAAGAIGVALLTVGGLSSAYASEDTRPERFGGPSRGGQLEVAAEVIGVTTDELQERINNGEKLREILETEGVTRDDMRAAMQERLIDSLQQAVSDGRITQAEADERLGEMAERHAQHEAARVALENNDYDAWSAASQGTPIAEKIDANNFAQFVRMHELQQEARTIAEELNIEGLNGKGKHGPRDDGEEPFFGNRPEGPGQ